MSGASLKDDQFNLLVLLLDLGILSKSCILL